LGQTVTRGRGGVLVTALKRIMAVLVLVMVLFALSGSTAFAEKPGPGTTQCSPGQSGNPNDPPKHPSNLCPGN
jgi:hypothetical protein